MKLYKRSDFLTLPAGTIYSRIYDESDMLQGLYAKASGEDYGNDWLEQDLISEIKTPDEITSGIDAMNYLINQIETHQEFETNLDLVGRDGMFDDDDKFVVWSKNDVQKLVDYLNTSLQNAY